MRILCCGSRYWDNYRLVLKVLRKYSADDPIIIHGRAPGADTQVDRAAVELGYTVMAFPAHWRHSDSCPKTCRRMVGKAAGPIRNKKMLVVGQPDEVLAFHEDLDKSKGTLNMVTQAKKAEIPVTVIGG